MQIVFGLTVDDLIEKAREINRKIGSGRKERHYQKCLDVELRAMGIPTSLEDPIPVFYKGEMVWQGRADLIIGKCCVELKAIAKPPSTAGRQLHDYITEKNKVITLHNAASGASIKHLFYWGLVINFNPATGEVETFIPPVSATKEDDDTSKDLHRRMYTDIELLGCRVKMNGIRGMVDSITVGEYGVILFQVQLSDGHRLPMRRSQLEPILSDIDIPVSSELKQKSIVSAFHSAVAYFSENRLKKTTNRSEFVTYNNLEKAFEDFSSLKIDGASMWFRNYMQKKFRVTYVKMHEKPREMVLFGGVNKGLVLQ
jgi:GxxExxY protein